MRRALRKFFDRKVAPNATAAAARAHDWSRAGQRTAQPRDDRAATGGRLEAELAAHRRQRDHTPQDDA